MLSRLNVMVLAKIVEHLEREQKTNIPIEKER